MREINYYTMTKEDLDFLKGMKPKLRKEFTFCVTEIPSPYHGKKPTGYLVSYNCHADLAYFKNISDARKYANRLWASI